MKSKTQVSYLRLVEQTHQAFVQEDWLAEERRDIERRALERMARQTPRQFEEDLLLYPDYPNGVSKEDDSVYHVFKNGEYTTLPSDAPKLKF